MEGTYHGPRKAQLGEWCTNQEVGLGLAWHSSFGSMSGQLSFPYADDLKPNIAAVPTPFPLLKKKPCQSPGADACTEGAINFHWQRMTLTSPVHKQRRDTATCLKPLYRSRPTCTCAHWHEAT